MKPGNILLYRDGRARLTDFGIVKDIGSLKGFLLNGTQVGTAFYASPEQCLGKRLGPGTDPYSLGATLNHAVCGRPPFPGKSRAAILTKHVKSIPIPAARRVPEIPKPLGNLIQKLLAKRVGDRPPDGANVARTLRMILDGKVAIGGLRPSRRSRR